MGRGVARGRGAKGRWQRGDCGEGMMIDRKTPQENPLYCYTEINVL